MLDLRRGVAVHARRGERTHYRPVRSVLVPGREGDAQALACAFRERLGASACYVADLDAILERAPQAGLVRELADPARGFGPGLWLDAGLRDADDLDPWAGLRLRRLVVGSETVAGPDALAAIARRAPVPMAFSLDLHGGVPRTAPGSGFEGETAQGLAERAGDAGIGCLIVLDLARVGSTAGPDVALLERVRRRWPGMLVAGGGVRDTADLAALAAVGCDAALVATALHEGRLGDPAQSPSAIE